MGFGFESSLFRFFKIQISSGSVTRWGVKRCCHYPTRFAHSDSESNSVEPVHLAHQTFPCSSDEPPLYVLHGLFGSKSNWNSLAKVMAKKRKVITVDSRNHGTSPQCMSITYDAMCQDLKSLISESGHTKIQLMGHSMGGKTCMLLALKYPQLVEKLVIVDVSPTPSPSGQSMQTILESLIRLKFDDSLSLHAGRKRADADLSATLTDPSLRHFLLTNLTKKDKHFKLRVDPHIIKANLHHILDFPPVESGITYDGDTFFIGGEKSAYISKDTEPAIKTLFPRARIQHIPDAGHWVHSEQPKLFLPAVEQFLAGS